MHTLALLLQAWEVLRVLALLKIFGWLSRRNISKSLNYRVFEIETVLGLSLQYLSRMMKQRFKKSSNLYTAGKDFFVGLNLLGLCCNDLGSLQLSTTTGMIHTLFTPSTSMARVRLNDAAIRQAPSKSEPSTCINLSNEARQTRILVICVPYQLMNINSADDTTPTVSSTLTRGMRNHALRILSRKQAKS